MEAAHYTVQCSSHSVHDRTVTPFDMRFMCFTSMNRIIYTVRFDSLAGQLTVWFGVLVSELIGLVGLQGWLPLVSELIFLAG